MSDKYNSPFGEAEAEPPPAGLDQPYGHAAHLYRDAGWLGVLPLPPRAKAHPPTGFTGRQGRDPDQQQVAEWTAMNGAGNVGLRLPLGVIGIDVDAHNGKPGAQSLAVLIEDYGPLPATWTSTSRGEGDSRIHLFRAPPGVEWSEARAGSGIDLIHHGHRYAAVWPSIHPDGGRYVWTHTDGRQAIGVPSPDSLAELPSSWVEGMRRQPALTAPPGHVAAGDPFGAPAHTPWTIEQAKRELTPRVDAFRRLRSPEDFGWNQKLNDLAVRVGRFVPAFFSQEAAREWLVSACHDNGMAAWPGSGYQATIASGLGAGMKQPYELRDPSTPSPAVGGEEERQSRWVDLTPYLDGTYSPPEPTVGAERDDNTYQLYPGRWHTLTAPTGFGKSWWALWHAKRVMESGGQVAYAHFEEAVPSGMIDRLRKMGTPDEMIAERFIWGDCTRSWQYGEFVTSLAELSTPPALVVLDGINAACTQHGQDVFRAESVGWYRREFVTPAARLGSAVLSLGHPVKDQTRQDERHGYGATGWLDEVDGVAFRLKPSKTPFRKGITGMAHLYSVKDRYGGVDILGVSDEKAGPQWVRQGSFIIDDSRDVTVMRLSKPEEYEDEDDGGPGGRERAADDEAVLAAVVELQGGEREVNTRAIRLAAGIGNERTADALERLTTSGRLHERAGARRARIYEAVEMDEDEEAGPFCD